MGGDESVFSVMRPSTAPVLLVTEKITAQNTVDSSRCRWQGQRRTWKDRHHADAVDAAFEFEE
jgi:hypothetical protein